MLFHQEPVGLALAAAAAVAQTLLNERATQNADPFSRTDGWRSHGVFTRRFQFGFGGEQVEAGLTYLHDGVLRFQVGRSAGLLEFTATPDGIDLCFAGQRNLVNVYRKGEVAHIHCAQGVTQIIAIDLLLHAGEGDAEVGRLTAPMPGKLVSFAVRCGDTVKKGQALAVLDAMKMEHTIAAPMDGVIAELLYAPGDLVVEGAELLKLVLP